jgi:hypothetical protein
MDCLLLNGFINAESLNLPQMAPTGLKEGKVRKKNDESWQPGFLPYF